ncbi:MAG: hypothetical protein ACRDRA_00680 [Pseudonocardiaceae bacterium]
MWDVLGLGRLHVLRGTDFPDVITDPDGGSIYGDNYADGDATGSGDDILSTAGADDSLVGDNVGLRSRTGGGRDLLHADGGTDSCEGGPAQDFASGCETSTDIPLRAKVPTTQAWSAQPGR